MHVHLTNGEGIAMSKYEDVSKMIYSQVHKFARRYGGDVEDLIGEAHLAYARGHKAYMDGGEKLQSRVPYHTVIRRWVWYEMFDAMRVRVKRGKNVKVGLMGDTDKDYEARSTTFNKDEFYDGLTEDAATVARLVLEPPAEIEKTVVAKGGDPRNYKSTVRSYLADAGWSNARVSAAFEELAEVVA